MLAIGGTLGDDHIIFTPGSNAGTIEVRLNGASLGVFSPTGRLVAYGQNGDDDIQVSGSINLPAWLYGQNGHDRLKGGSGHDVLLGGPGDDWFFFDPDLDRATDLNDEAFASDLDWILSEV